ncbi:MAG TPA: 6-carboxytetrahydropterin synthase [Gemmatimonadales bacterium]|nr:6-carboxytetrahydropterin synthase [Gemmatimonadales bacterium]
MSGSRSGSFRVSVTKDYLIFAAAHFITFRGHRCEALHGHNYRVGIAVEGTTDDEVHWVLDFSDLKQLVRALLAEVDHRVLLPTESVKLRLEEADERITVYAFDEPRYVFPARDCVRLPVPNTTVEKLAEYFAHRVREGLAAKGFANLTRLELEVEESPGQSATYRLALGA